MNETAPHPSDWYAPLRDVRSLGSMARRPGSLAGLHLARQEHLSQFFTPDNVAAFMWRLAQPAMAAALERAPGSRVAVFDNSVGSGRLLQFADPERHVIGGADIHAPTVEQLVDRATSAGFEMELRTLALEDQRASGWGVGLINPPFSVHLESPLLVGGETTCAGRFGPHTSAISHAYALERALDACDLVIALLPTSFAATLKGHAAFGEKLKAIYRLGGSVFKSETAVVDVSVAVFGAGPALPVMMDLVSLDADLPPLPIRCSNTHERPPELRSIRVNPSEPVITLAPTGTDAVRLTHSGRKLQLHFRCGLVQAKVMNSLLRSVLPPRLPEEGRYPVGVKYAGQGVFDLELVLAQPDPLAAWGDILEAVRAAGGRPLPDPGILGYLRRRRRLYDRAATPLGRVALIHGPGASGNLTATPKEAIQCNPARWGSGLFLPGQEVSFAYEGGVYTATHPTSGEVLSLEESAFLRSFRMLSEVSSGPQWTTIHDSREIKYPELAKQIRLRLERTGGAAVASWTYQQADVVEMLVARSGIVAFQMGLGKTRAAIALCLAGGKRNLICVEAHLIDEILTELRAVGVPADEYQVIRSPEDCANLRRINLISYSRLRMPISDAHARRTYASLLRRRIATMVCDEAHLLRNRFSAQTRAVYMVSPKRRYGMTGTPIANMPRDLLPQLQWVGGDGTAIQPFGFYRPYLTPDLLHSMHSARRGTDVFRDEHVVTEWVTAQFEEDFTGGKREVPKLANLAALRAWTAPFIKRRIAQEPEVSSYIRTPAYDVLHHELSWDDNHLGYWLTIADDFAAWYRDMRARSGDSGKQINLVALLARIGAVLMAGNYPQYGIKGFPTYGQMTSKQRFTVERAVSCAQDGHKTMVFVENPGLAECLARSINQQGALARAFHGKMSITERNQLLAKGFRRGPVEVLVCTYGVVQTGLNIPEASRGIFGSRAWTTKTEMQARYRMLRPQQTQRCQFETLELPGSLDTYQAMMLAFKQDASGAAVDYLTPELDDAEFLHLDTVVERFVEGLAARRGLKSHDLREKLKHAA
ncbi:MULTISPECIES: DEAD/DEAH box helicase [unclassified Dyella]|uniref:SNF2-related protein n=1 Tax=Dyella sp. ASV21 TaxID=2795114 RepID=UPI0018EC95AF|nr:MULTISPECIES: DEAD/DEAH box helicase [unclassified Dyella]